MEDLTGQFGELYHPVSALLIYQAERNGYNNNSVYVESYDINKFGQPINAHPLSVSESMALAKALDTTEELNRSFLKPQSLLPKNVLYINPEQNGFAIWYTAAQERHLLFADSLKIPNGKAAIPALIWKATKEHLFVYALKSTTNLQENTILYYAPFFNIYESGNVCMGTVDIDITSECYLEDFIEQWEDYFFNSYFSHLVREHNPVKGDITILLQKLVNMKGKFPLSQLKENGLTIKDIL